jgi:hypothetical protein
MTEPWDIRHWPAVALRTDGSWGVFCRGCSTDSDDGDYVYPCRKRTHVEWPPQRLYEARHGVVRL